MKAKIKNGDFYYIRGGAIVEIGGLLKLWSRPNLTMTVERVLKYKARLIGPEYGERGNFGEGPVLTDITDLEKTKG